MYKLPVQIIASVGWNLMELTASLTRSKSYKYQFLFFIIFLLTCKLKKKLTNRYYFTDSEEWTRKSTEQGNNSTDHLHTGTSMHSD